MYELDRASFKLISAGRLKREAEHCLETTDAFKELIDAQPGYKEYWKVVIYPIRAEDEECPILEVAGFMDKKIAQSYMNNIIKKHKDWDDSILNAQLLLYALPPCTDSDSALTAKIKYLKSLSEQSPK